MENVEGKGREGKGRNENVWGKEKNGCVNLDLEKDKLEVKREERKPTVCL